MRDDQTHDQLTLADKSLPLAAPLEPLPAPRMAPARVVSPEVASILPPIGILPRAAVVPPADLPPSQRKPMDVPRRKAPPRNMSASLTIAAVVTAMGAGGLAMLAALENRQSEPRKARSTAELARDDSRDKSAAVPAQASEIPPLFNSNAAPFRSIGTTQRFGPTGDVDALPAELAQIIGHLREREFAAASARLQPLTEASWPPAEADRITRYAALVLAVRDFWDALEAALSSAPAGRSVSWEGRQAAIVEVTPSHVVLRRAGTQLRIRRQDLPAQAVRALAESLLDMDDAPNQVQLGAFLLTQQSPDRRAVRELWESAASLDETALLLLPLVSGDE